MTVDVVTETTIARAIGVVADYAADPSNVEWACRLAVDYESRGALDRCETILAPLRTRLGELEGARLLGLVDARANRVAALPAPAPRQVRGT